jgi:hypothetical protein
MIVATVLCFPILYATLMEATTLAPVEVPANIPSSLASLLAMVMASSVLTVKIPSTKSGCHTGGINPMPIPSIL